VVLLSLGWGLYRFRLLDVRSLALDIAVERMRDSLFVLDEKARLVDLNAPASSLLRSKQVPKPVGMPVVQLLPGLQELLEQPSGSDVESVIRVDVWGVPRSHEEFCAPARWRLRVGKPSR
jgi:hypothetical protein